MKRNRLGRTDISVSEICLGTMTWGRQNSEAEAHEQLAHALDEGINFLDTAELYAIPPRPETYGKTETIIGNYFAKSGNRDKWIVATKIAGHGTRWIRDGAPISRATIREAIEGSLRRLQTDHIDLYQLHWPNRGHYHFENSWAYDPTGQDRDAVLPNMLEVMETLGELVTEGKVRHIGLSNESAWGTMQYLKFADQHGLPRIVTIQNEYNLLRRYYDMDLAELAHHEDVGLLAYSPLAAGALSGKYLDGALPEGTRGAISGGAYRNNMLTEPAIRAYIELAENNGLDVCQMALAFCLTKPFMTSVIIGATSMEQLKSNIAAAELTLSDKVLDGIQSIFKQYPRTL
ncbi:MAG: aldo/keto reductase [Hyphomicrobiaceae bacterium]|nr:aldo/keto reductase [Hyphomicrobiaceae bacterium]